MAELFWDDQSESHFTDLMGQTGIVEVTAFLGAGASASAGLPSWSRLVSVLCEGARGPG